MVRAREKMRAQVGQMGRQGGGFGIPTFALQKRHVRRTSTSPAYHCLALGGVMGGATCRLRPKCSANHSPTLRCSS